MSTAKEPDIGLGTAYHFIIKNHSLFLPDSE